MPAFSLVEGDPESSLADVVFLHGLGGRGHETWLARGEEVPWPTWLVEDDPRVAVWFVDYGASPLRVGSSMTLRDRTINLLSALRTRIGHRPFILVGHSLGGLLIKQMVEYCDTRRDDLRHAMDQLSGVIFFATPHAGSSVATVSRTVAPALFSTLVGDLELNAPTLLDTASRYRDYVTETKLPHLTFRETRKTKGQMIVDASSADPGLPFSTPVPVDADHVSICKLKNRDDDIYLRVRDFVGRCLSTASNRKCDFRAEDWSAAGLGDHPIADSHVSAHLAVSSSATEAAQLLGEVRRKLARLGPKGAGSSTQLRGLASSIEALMSRLIGEARSGAQHVRSQIHEIVQVVTQLEQRLPEAVALRIGLANLYGAIPDYVSAAKQIQHILLSPGRVQTTDDIMLLALHMMNASEYGFAAQLLDLVSGASATHGKFLLPPGETETARQRVMADQYRLLWIPHELGRPTEAIANAKGVLVSSRELGPDVEAAALHRIARAQTDLAVATSDRDLLEEALKNHTVAIGRADDTYNFFMPLAKYYTSCAAYGRSEDSLLHETLELSRGLNEGADAHIWLLEARRAIDAGQYFKAIEHAELAADAWGRHPHPSGVVDALSARAKAQYRIATSGALVSAVADLEAAQTIAANRGFNMNREGRFMLGRLQGLFDSSDQHRIRDQVVDFEASHPGLYERIPWAIPGLAQSHITNALDTQGS